MEASLTQLELCCHPSGIYVVVFSNTGTDIPQVKEFLYE
jgi:hypothetical protein